MKKESTKAQKKDVKPVADVKRQSGKRSKLKKVEVAVNDVPKVIEQPPVLQAADAVAVIPPSESNVLQDSTEQSAVAAVMESAEITGLPPEPQTTDAIIVTIPKESKVLRERLGLTGFITETVKLPTEPKISVLGQTAESVVFAKQIVTEHESSIIPDRILLHINLLSEAGVHSIVSSKRKLSAEEWINVTEALIGMKYAFRERELKVKPAKEPKPPKAPKTPKQTKAEKAASAKAAAAVTTATPASIPVTASEYIQQVPAPEQMLAGAV
jgi:hypothetical protein